jgi:hypothetical protein
MTNSASYPPDSAIPGIVAKRGIRSAFFWGVVTGVVAISGQALLIVPLALFLVAWGLWCAFGITLSFLMAALKLFGIKPEGPYDAAPMWVAGIVRLIEGAFYIACAIFLYRVFAAT